MGPQATGTILVLYGHGSLRNETYDFRRPDAAKVNLYAWTREGIPVWDVQIKLAAEDALQSGTIRASFSTVNSSRIGGAQIRDYDFASPVGLALPTVPVGYHTTLVATLGATVHHNNATLATSTRMLLMLNPGAPMVRQSTILHDPAFANRTMDALWCACRS
jgi:hypothetical protein